MKRAGRTRQEKDLLSKLLGMINYVEYIHANMDYSAMRLEEVVVYTNKILNLKKGLCK